MKFNVITTPSIALGKLLYVKEDYAFNFILIAQSVVTSVVIDTLQLAIDSNGQVLGVWGYWPYQLWNQAEISPPTFTRGNLFVELDNIITGVSRQVPGAEEWITFFNLNTNWICIGEPHSSEEELAVEFASNCIAITEDDLLKAIWLHPENLPVGAK